jgi:glycosyltransferase involved in cell wall biosynthesis
VTEQTLVLYSRLAYYPVHWLALEEIVRRYEARAVVLAAPPPADLPSVHAAHGRAGADCCLPVEVREVPADRASRVCAGWRGNFARWMTPLGARGIDPFCLEMLALYRRRPRPRIAVAVCESIFPPPSRAFEQRARRWLWPRIDHLLAVAQPSLDGIRAAGMPASVMASTLVAGGLEPDGEVEPMGLPFEPGSFIVGFAGRLIEAKGWRLLLSALERLPAHVTVAIAGDGPQRADLELAMRAPALEGRVHFAGLLPKDELWGFYAALDCLAVPSLTTPRWKEQSASTLVDGLCMGLPIVGSDSGGIPDMIGEAGLIVAEGDDRGTRSRDRAPRGRCRSSPAARRRGLHPPGRVHDRCMRTRSRPH